MFQRLIKTRDHRIAEALLHPALDAAGVDLDVDDHAFIHRHRERLSPGHAAHAGSEYPPAFEGAAKVPARTLGKGLVRALNDALRADVDPRPGGHLAVHDEPQRLQLPEVIPVGPGRHEI